MKKIHCFFGVFLLLCIVTACGRDTAPGGMEGEHSVLEEIEADEEEEYPEEETEAGAETLPETASAFCEETEAEDISVYMDTFYEQHYGGMTGEQIEAIVSDRGEYYNQSGYFYEITDYWENDREVRDIANRLEPLFYTDMKYYSREEFQDLPDVVIHLAKNEIYARRGYIFSDADLYNYFMGCAWYQPVYSSGEFDDSIWNDYERENLKLLAELDRL